MQKRLFWFAVLFFLLPHAVFACRTGNSYPIYFNGYVAHGYGDVAVILAWGTLYLQLRLRGFTKLTFFWCATLIAIYFLNPGPRYRGVYGDCGDSEVDGAYNFMFYNGALLLWQIGAAVSLIWHQKSHRAGRSETPQPTAQPPAHKMQADG